MVRERRDRRRRPTATPPRPEGELRRGRSKAGRVLLLLFFCAGVAGLGLFTGGEHRIANAKRDPLAGYYPPDMPRYPEAREIPAGVTRVGASPLAMSYFESLHDPGRIADYYANFWRGRRFWVNSDVTHRGGVVAAVDPQHGRIYQLLLQVQGKKTLVFPSVNSAPLATLSSGAPSPVPLFRDSKVLTNTVTKAGANGAQVVLSTNGGTLEENRAHYRAELSRAQYREERRVPSAQKLPGALAQNVLIYRNAEGAEVTIMLTALDDKRTRVHLTKVAAR